MLIASHEASCVCTSITLIVHSWDHSGNLETTVVILRLQQWSWEHSGDLEIKVVILRPQWWSRDYSGDPETTVVILSLQQWSWDHSGDLETILVILIGHGPQLWCWSQTALSSVPGHRRNGLATSTVQTGTLYFRCQEVGSTNQISFPVTSMRGGSWVWGYISTTGPHPPTHHIHNCMQQLHINSQYMITLASHPVLYVRLVLLPLEMGDTILQLAIPPIPILPHAVPILGSLQATLIRHLAHVMYFWCTWNMWNICAIREVVFQGWWSGSS